MKCTQILAKNKQRKVYLYFTAMKSTVNQMTKKPTIHIRIELNYLLKMKKKR